MAKKVFIRTYGCQMNEYDSARMLDALREGQAMESTDRPEDADLILLNTCSIREKAQEKVFSELGRYRSLKADKPDLLIGVGGCVASQEGHAIADRAPFVDLVFGPQTLHRLPEMIDERRAGAAPGAKRRPPLVDISFPEIEKFDRLPEPRAEGPTAFVSIMEGVRSTAASAWCPTPGERKSAAPWNRCLRNARPSPGAGFGRSIFSGRT